MKDNQIKKLASASLMTALVAISTMIIHIPVPTGTGGYINAGDSMVYMSAYFIGGFSGALAAAIGSALADILLGAAVYAVPTFIIKGCMSLIVFVIIKNNCSFSRFVAACAVGGVVMVFGYIATEFILFGKAAVIAAVIPNLIQFAGGIVIAICLFAAFKNIPRKLDFKG